jgi:nanoRNase/pAp phosphatase (c-di-AMP/oligoRNAs hydrolase)
MSESLEAAARAVPEAVVERLSGAHCVLAVTHENPDADTLGASLGVQRLVGAFGGSVTLVSSDPVPRLYDFLPGIDQFRSDPDPAAGYDLLVASDFGTPDRMGSVRERHAALLERLPRVTIAPSRQPRPTASTRPPQQPARWSPCSRFASASR